MAHLPSSRPLLRRVPGANARVRSLLWFVAGLALVGLVALLTPVRPVYAQAAVADPLAPADELASQVRSLVAAPAAGQRVEVQLGALDPRLRLAPCGRIEPYVPAGARLFGRTRVGLRCTDGQARWNVTLPVTVRVFGQALVAAAPLAAGTTLAGSEFTLNEVDLAEGAGTAIVDAEPLAGRTLARALRAGETLRTTHLRARQWFAAGDLVQLSAIGDGFRIGGLAQALTPGIEGQPARVRTESGRVLTGKPIGNGRIEVVL